MYTLKERLEGEYGIVRIPQYIASRCNDRKSQGGDCTICAEICPEHIYPAGKRKHPVWDRCVKCGLCAATCPSRCIVPPADRVNTFLLAVAKRGRLTIGCQREEHALRLNPVCVAAVSWEQLAYAALNKGVVVSLRCCEGCMRVMEKRLIEDNLKTLWQFLGQKLFSERVTVLTGDDEMPVFPEETVSRRELLSFVGNTALDKAFSMLPKVDTKRENSLFYRSMLREAVAKQAPETKFTVPLPRFNAKCYNCGYCAHACPNEALKLIPGNGIFTVTVEAWKCTGCSICQNTCRSGGISGLIAAKISTLGTVALGRFTSNLCAECGNNFPPVPGAKICATCQNKKLAQQRRIRENAKAEGTNHD